MVSPRVTGSLRPDDFVIILDQSGEISAYRVEAWELSVRTGEIRPVFDNGRTTEDLSAYTQVRMVSRETDPTNHLFELAERMLESKNTDEGSAQDGEARETVDCEREA